MIALDSPIVKECEGFYIASNPRFGALSALTASELVAFHLYRAQPRDPSALINFYRQSGMDADDASLEAEKTTRRWEAEGWLRSEFPDQEAPPLSAVYFTVTRYCDLACPYCYQGLNDRHNTDMSLAQVSLILDKIVNFNPRCTIVVSGGEPFTHPQIFDILDAVEARDLKFTILSNGTHITDDVAGRLKQYPALRFVQISLDGFSEETFAATRGKKAFAKVMNGINSVITQDIPFVLAPTIHEGNAHELVEISEFALKNGGWVSPNALRHLPHDSNKQYLDASGSKLKASRVDPTDPRTFSSVEHPISMSEQTLLGFVAFSARSLEEKYGRDFLAKRAARFTGVTDCSINEPNSKSLCGTGQSLLDINFNGDVYPCHMLKADELILGNLFECNFEDIFAAVAAKGIRVKSNEIEKCSGCDYNSTCGSGCRAGAYNEYGSFLREDSHCKTNSREMLRSLFHNVAARDPALQANTGAFYHNYLSLDETGAVKSRPGQIPAVEIT